MSDIPPQTSDDPRDIDHGELFRPDNRQLPVPVAAAKKTPREVKLAIGVAVAAIAAALFTLTR